MSCDPSLEPSLVLCLLTVRGDERAKRRVRAGGKWAMSRKTPPTYPSPGLWRDFGFFFLVGAVVWQSIVPSAPATLTNAAEAQEQPNTPR